MDTPIKPDCFLIFTNPVTFWANIIFISSFLVFQDNFAPYKNVI